MEHLWAKEEDSILNEHGVRDVNKRRLGNFVLLEPATNIRERNKPIDTKIKEFKESIKNKSHTRMLREAIEAYDNTFDEADSKWDRHTWRFWYYVIRRTFDKREQDMISFALERWFVPTEQNLKNVTIVTDEDEKINFTYEEKESS